MLRQCLEHGYFRGNICSQCNQKGRFLMNDNELNGLGRMLAGVLRHFPEKFKLSMDDNGWIVISDLINAIRNRSSQYHWFRPHHLIAIVETDPKGRYQIRDNLIRATYGHSIDVDLDLPTDDIPEILYYPTTREEVDLLMETGLKPSDRKKVHLSLTLQDAENAGKVRVPNPIILEIDAKGSISSGNIIAHAGTTVYTTREIMPEFIRLNDKSHVYDITPGIENTMIKNDSKIESKPEETVETTEEKKEEVVEAKEAKEAKKPKETKKKSSSKTKAKKPAKTSSKTTKTKKAEKSKKAEKTKKSK